MRPGTKKTLSILLTFALVWLAVRWLMPLLMPFLLGTALALAAEPMTRFFRDRLRLPRSISTGISVSMAFGLLFLTVLLAAAFVLRELKALAGVLPDLEQTARSGMGMMEDWLRKATSRAPRSLRPLLDRNVTELFSGGSQVLDGARKWLLGLAGTVLTHVPDSALSLGTAVISGFMISAKLPRLRLWLARRFPREKLRPLLDAAHRIKAALGRWISAQAKLAGFTWLLLTLGFLLLKIRYAPLWALAVAVVDVFPVLGTGTVLLPWAVFSLLQRNTARAVGLTALYLVVTLTRSALEPKLLGKHLGLDPLATLVAMYAGYKLWGIPGMLLAPLIAVTAIQLVPERQEG